MQAEFQAISNQTACRAAYLRLAETLPALLECLRSNAQTLDMVGQRQKIMRLLVKEVIAGKDLITIKLSIPGHAAPHRAIRNCRKCLPSPILHRPIKVIFCKGRDCITSVCCPF